MRIALVVALVVAGCAADAPAAPDQDTPQLRGWVTDPAINPLSGIEVRVLDRDITNTTDVGGHYALDGLPTDVPLVLVASGEGLKTMSKQVTLPMDGHVILNFTLTPEPVLVPTHEVLEFQGRINCQGMAVSGDDEVPVDCSAGEGQQDTWDFTAEAYLAGAVIEVSWEAGSQLASSFGVRVETIGYGDANEVLGETVGTSPLRIQVAEAKAAKFYPAGGAMRVTVWVEPNVDEEEASSGVGLAVNQPFEAFASLFYVEPPEATYTAL